MNDPGYRKRPAAWNGLMVTVSKCFVNACAFVKSKGNCLGASSQNVLTIGENLHGLRFVN